MMIAVLLALTEFVCGVVGTENTDAVSCGNVYPAITRPWGMNCWTAQTGKTGSGWIYDWRGERIRGFRQTHQPSPWTGDYGQFAVMPMTGKAGADEDSRASAFSHKTETVLPYKYGVYLAEHDVWAELAPTERAAIMRIRYPKCSTPRFVVDAFAATGSCVRIDAPHRRVYGTGAKMFIRWNEGECNRLTYATHFVVEFDRDVVAGEVSADGVLADIRFAPTEKDEVVTVRIASSFIDREQAERNLGEVLGRDFDSVAEAGRSVWEEALGRLRAEGGREEDFRKFYTCLYRALLFPRGLHEPDADGRMRYRDPNTGAIREGWYYTDTGFWDTFRALFPLLNLVYPETAAKALAGLEACWKESGWLPEWASPGFRQCMIGNHSASVVADAYFSGIAQDVNITNLYQAVVHGANAAHPTYFSVGRLGYEDYNRKGYVPRDTGVPYSASRTIEYAYDDWCIWRLGVALGRPASETGTYLARSRNWQNVFDGSRGLACGRGSDGTFERDFDCFRWDGDFVEGNALQFTWSVLHDVDGLVAAMGGREAFVRTLDSLFESSPVLSRAKGQEPSHEMREMQISGFGQYAHGNQPVQHAIYLYDYVGDHRRVQKLVRQVRDRLYHPTPDGYCGDEDNGQTSAWFVWSAMGLYPVCPASGEYALGIPLFRRMTVSLSGGRTCRIVLECPADAESVTFSPANGGGESRLTRPVIGQAEIRAGGTLLFR